METVIGSAVARGNNMKTNRKQSGVVNCVMVLGALFGAFLAIGLFIPVLRPLALRLGDWWALGFVAWGFIVAGYAGWRIVTYPGRSRKAMLHSQRRHS